MAYGMLIDLKKCVGCHACAVACKEAHGTPPGITRSHVKREFEGEYPDATMHIVPMLCMHCENPPCVEACPTEGATYKREDGIVVVDKEKCIGCKYCMMACPYGVRDWNKAESVVEKCTLCQHLTAAGEKPQCVKVCSVQCRFYGDLDDPESDASKAIAAKPDAAHRLKDFGNGPSTVYLLSDKYCEWRESTEYHDTCCAEGADA